MQGKLEQKTFLTGKGIALSKLTFIQVIGMALVFASNLYLTNILSNDQYGLYVSIVQGIALTSILLIGGLDELITVEIPRMVKKEDWAAAKGMHRWSNQIIRRRFGILLLCAALGLGVQYILNGNNILSPTYFLASGVILLCSTFLLKQISELRAAANYSIAHLLDLVIRPLGILLFLFIAVSVLHIPAVTSTVLIVVLIVLLLTTLSAQLVLKRSQPYLKRYATEDHSVDTKQWAVQNRLSAFNWSSILYFMITKIDLFLLVVLGTTEVVGQYNVAGRVAEWCMLPAVILNTAYTKEVVESSLIETNQRLPRLIRHLIGKSALFTTMMAAVLLTTGIWLLPLFGASYASGYTLLIPLTASYLLMATGAPINHWLKVKGMEALSLRIAGTTVLTQGIICGFLICLYGALGAAWGMLLANTLYFLLLLNAIRSIRA